MNPFPQSAFAGVPTPGMCVSDHYSEQIGTSYHQEELPYRLLASWACLYRTFLMLVQIACTTAIQADQSKDCTGLLVESAAVLRVHVHTYVCQCHASWCKCTCIHTYTYIHTYVLVQPLVHDKHRSVRCVCVLNPHLVVYMNVSPCTFHEWTLKQNVKV